MTLATNSYTNELKNELNNQIMTAVTTSLTRTPSQHSSQLLNEQSWMQEVAKVLTDQAILVINAKINSQ